MAVRTTIVLAMALITAVSYSRGQDAGSSTPRRRGTTSGVKSSDEVTTSGALTAPANRDDPTKLGLCRLTTTDPYVHNTVVQMLTEVKVTLIEYQLSFANYSENPLGMNVGGAYDAKKWSRVTTAHGQTLLSLAFNYGVLSMMTLTLGTETLDVQLRDSPSGCMHAADDQVRAVATLRHADRQLVI